MTRADHLACAEMYAVTGGRQGDRSRVAGNAHEVRDKLLRYLENAETSSVVYPHAIEIAHEMVNAIPESTKFELGKANMEDSYHCPFDRPWLYRLPFRNCFFEVDIPFPDGKTQKTFFLAREDEKDLFSASVMAFDDSRQIALDEFFIFWDTSGEEVRCGLKTYNNNYIAPKDAIIENGVYCARALMPFLKRLNDMESELQLIVPRARKFRKRDPFNTSPYYDYHILRPAPRSVGTWSSLEEEGERRRLHKRRGHNREYKHPRFTNLQGEILWIPEKTWGDPEIGVLGKAYDLRIE